jgi:hypothetical protein
MAEREPRSEKNGPLALAGLITDRCRTLGLSQADLIRRTGYRNLARGVRRLHDLLAGDLIKTKALIDFLPVALALPDDVVRGAVDDMQRELDARKLRQWEADEAKWRAAFRPHAIILTERRIPTPLFMALMGVDRLLRIDFDTNADPVRFLSLALEGFEQKTAQWGRTFPGFGKPTGIVVNYAPDRAMRFDLAGAPQDVLDKAYRIGEVRLHIKGAPDAVESLLRGARSD